MATTNLSYLQKNDSGGGSRAHDNYLKQVRFDQPRMVLRAYTHKEPIHNGIRTGRAQLDNHYILFFLVKGERKVQYTFEVGKETIYHRPRPYNKELTKCIGLIDIKNTKKYRNLVTNLSGTSEDINEKNNKYIESLGLETVKKVDFSFIDDIPIESIRCLHEKIDPIYEKLITSDDGECGSMNRTLGVSNIKFSLTYTDIDIIPHDTKSPPRSDRKVVNLRDRVSFSDNELYTLFMHTIQHKDQKLTIILNKNVIEIYYIYLEYMYIALLNINMITPYIAIVIIETQLSLYRPFINSPCNLSGFIERMKHKTIPISELLEINKSESKYTYPVVDQNNGFFSIINKYLFDESGKITEAMEKVLKYYNLNELETNDETYIFKSNDAPIVSPIESPIESSEKKTKKTTKKTTKKEATKRKPNDKPTMTLEQLTNDPIVKQVIEIRETYNNVVTEKAKFKERGFTHIELEKYFEYLSLHDKNFPFRPRGDMSSKINKLMIYKYPGYKITSEMLKNCVKNFSLAGLKYIYERLTGEQIGGDKRQPLCDEVALRLT